MNKITFAVSIFVSASAWGATNQMLSLMPPALPVSTNKLTTTKSVVTTASLGPQYALLSWQTNAEAESYIVQSTTDLKTWKEEGRYVNTNAVHYFIANTPHKFYKVYGHAEEKTNYFVQLSFTYTNDPFVDEFRIYSGTNAGIYPDVSIFPRLDFTTNDYTGTISNLTSNTTYYFRAIAIDTSHGLKSDYSVEEVVHTTPTNKWKFHKQVPAKLKLVEAPAGALMWRAVPTRPPSTNSIVDTKTKAL